MKSGCRRECSYLPTEFVWLRMISKNVPGQIALIQHKPSSPSNLKKIKSNLHPGIDYLKNTLGILELQFQVLRFTSFSKLNHVSHCLVLLIRGDSLIMWVIIWHLEANISKHYLKANFEIIQV